MTEFDSVHTGGRKYHMRMSATVAPCRRTAGGGVLAIVLSASALLLAAAGPTAAATYNPNTLTSEQLAQVEQRCETDLRLQRGEAHFDACVAGLSESLTGAGQAEQVRSARAACFETAPTPGTPELADCLLQASEGRPATGATFKSYFRASPSDIRQGEERSCARLGLDPIGGAFQTCVANLAVNLGALDQATF